VPNVDIANGAHKYVQIRASCDGGDEQIFVTSKKGASYHRNAAEPFIFKLEAAGYHDVEVTGGGRLFLDSENKQIKIFGFSYGFGKANHDVSRQVVMQDVRYKDFDVTTSDEGY
jgi:phosphohistidine phosphatase